MVFNHWNDMHYILHILSYKCKFNEMVFIHWNDMYYILQHEEIFENKHLSTMQPRIRCLIALKIYRHTREGNTYFKKYHGVSYNNMHTIWRYIDVHIVLNANSGQWNGSLWYIWSTIYNVSLRKVFIVWCFFWKQTSIGFVGHWSPCCLKGAFFVFLSM